MKKIIKKSCIVIIVAFVISIMSPSILLQCNTVEVAEAATTKINKTKATIRLGETLQLKITGTKSKVTWSSNNKKIATVTSDGLVKGIKSGTAFITAKVDNKNYTCRVLVAFPTLESSRITLRYDNAKQIIIKNLPKQYTQNDITWVSDNPNIVSVDNNGNLLGLGEGYATVTASFGKNKLRCQVTVPSFTEEEKQSFMNKIEFEHGEFNNKEVYILKNNVANVNVDYQIEFYNKSNELVSVSRSQYIQLLKGRETIIYIDKPEKEFEYYKFRYNTITPSYSEVKNTIDVNIMVSELYDYTYSYIENGYGLYDTVRIFDLIVDNRSNNRLSFNASVIYYKDDKIVDIRHYNAHNLDVGTSTIKYFGYGYSKIYAPDYDDFRIIDSTWVY